MTRDKPEAHVVSFSGGKDSTAMLLKMLERGMPIDYVMFIDTGLDFPGMLEHIARVERDIAPLKITRVKAKHSFEWYMFNKPIKRKRGSWLTAKEALGDIGEGWPSARCRWCLQHLKDEPANDFYRPLRKNYKIIEYVGIAADETRRLARPRQNRKGKRYPLVEWGMTEAAALEFCKARGYDWGGLYEKFTRVSCWCCPLQSLQNLRVLWRDFPKLWRQLQAWQDKQPLFKFKPGWSVGDLAARFKFERERERASLPLKGREFYAAMHVRLCGKAISDLQLVIEWR